MYDERAVSFITKLDKLITKRAPGPSRELGALLNALECHVEDGLGHPDIARGVERVFFDLASLRRVNTETVRAAKKLFHDLVQHLHAQSAGT